MYHLCLHLALGLGMKRHSVAQKESLVNQFNYNLFLLLHLRGCSFYGCGASFFSLTLSLFAGTEERQVTIRTLPSELLLFV